VLTHFQNREVIIRTLDVGGDKPLPYLNIHKEENPFLGYRAIRYCLDHPVLFKTQLKALLLANEFGNLSIMIPMVSRTSELIRVKELLNECESELKSQSNYVARPYRLGTMIEIPSLVFEIEELSKVVSFVSVGTNDLLQYTLAVDRLNPNTQNLYSPYHLGFLRLMKHLADSAKTHSLEISICGELGGRSEFMPLWLAMGFQKLSMNCGEILNKRQLLSQIDSTKAKPHLEAALKIHDESALKAHLKRFVEELK
jgi:phosphotransferase system enzyme I (PtsI)